MSAKKTEKATFGAGCYWGSERAFREVAGVLDTSVGFMDDIEVVAVEYDPAAISYDGLLAAFWGSHDATAGVGRVPAGERSAIFVDGEAQKEQARAAKAEVAQGIAGKIVTEIRPAAKFNKAPERDQRYYEKRAGS